MHTKFGHNGARELIVDISDHRRAFVAAIAFAFAAPALAQTTPSPALKPSQSASAGASTDAGSTLEEVVVTATRRETNLQTVGIAISAFTGQELVDLGVNQTTDLAAVTPGLQFSAPGGSPVAGLLAIRGVSQNDFAGHIEPANAFYIDQVYQPSNAASVQEFYDVNRVEVLKGPQGTLFGRNATGGLVHVITNQPTDQVEGFANLSGGSYGQVRFEGAIGGPVTDGVSGRVAVLRDKSDGFVKNAIGPALLKDDTYAVRGQLRIAPSDRLTVLLEADTYIIEPVTTGGDYITGAYPGPDGLGLPLPEGSPTGFGYVPSGDPYRGSFDYPGRFARRVSSGAAHVTYDFSNGLSLSSITSYQRLHSEYSADNDFSPIPFAIFDQNASARHLTQELRLSGATERNHWTAGLYFLRIDGAYLQAFDILPIATRPLETHSVDTKSYSAFGQDEIQLRDDLRLTAGVRGTRDHKDYEYQENCTGPACSGLLAPGTIGTAGLVTDSHAETGWSGRLELDWQATRDTMYYASINHGYKAFNYNAGFVGHAPLDMFRFHGENLLAYEVGSKLEFLERRARLNVAAFYYDYSDYQAFDQRGFNFTLFNTSAHMYGADADLTLRPLQGLTLNAGAAFLHTAVDDIPIANETLTRNAPQSPDFTFNVSATRSVAIGSSTLSATLEGNYIGDFYAQLTNAPVTLIPHGWLANARLSLATYGNRVTLEVSANNVFNNAKPAYAFDNSSPPLGATYNTYVRPRWINAGVNYKF
jgi:iron complex outermembrane receptor protein